METIRILLPVLWSMLRVVAFAFLRWPERAACLTVWFASFQSGRRRSFFAHAVAASAAGSGLVDPRKTPQYLKFCQFADQVAADPALAKSVEGRDRYDFQKPNTRSKAYKAALACL